MPSCALSNRRGNARLPPICKKPLPPYPPASIQATAYWYEGEGAMYGAHVDITATDPAWPVGEIIGAEIASTGPLTFESPIILANGLPGGGDSNETTDPYTMEILVTVTWPGPSIRQVRTFALWPT